MPVAIAQILRVAGRALGVIAIEGVIAIASKHVFRSIRRVGDKAVDYMDNGRPSSRIYTRPVGYKRR